MREDTNIYADENVIDIDVELEYEHSPAVTEPEDISAASTEKQLAQVSETEIIDIEIEEAFPYTSNNDLANHQILNNRDAANAHPIGAISGLRDELDYIRSYKRVYSSENGLAEFIRWSDENPSWEDRSGYFVKLVFDVSTGVEHAAICTDKDDVYGVAVQISGFVGNQINDENGAGHSDDPAYAMVGLVGLLRVRTDGTAQIGDYVVPSAAGIATKSEHSCGYRVISTGSYPSYSYVTIAVTPQNDKINKIYGMLMESDGSIGNISLRIDAIESDITSASNKVDVAIRDMDELKDLMGECEIEIDRIDKLTNETNGIVQEAIVSAEQTIQAANEAKDAAQAAARDAKLVVADLADMSDLADSMEEVVGYTYIDEDGNVYKGAAGLVRLANETHVDYGILAEQVTQQGDDLAGMIVAVDKKHGASIQHLVSHIDKYSVGEMSLSYGLTVAEAQSILKNDYIYVPTSTHTESIDDKTISFERGYAYTWDAANITWVKGAAVSTATTYAAGANEGDLWYCFQDVAGSDGRDYLAETLYRWSGSEWIAVATMRDNHRNRMVSSIKQTADAVKAEVVGARGDSASLKIELDRIGTLVADNKGNISSVTQRVDGIDTTIANINGTLTTTQQRVTDNEASISMINHGAFHVVYQSFATSAPAAVGNKYTVPPTWNDTAKQFEFNAAMASSSGIYYFHSTDKTKYVKVVNGGYEIYTIGNLATASYDSRINANGAEISQLTTYVDTQNEAQNTNIAGIISTADADRATVTTLAQTVSSNKDTADKNHSSAMAAISQETSNREAAITALTTCVDNQNNAQNTNIAGIISTANSDRATVTALAKTVSDNKTTEDNRHTEAMAAIQAETSARGAAITNLTTYVANQNNAQNTNIASIQQQANANGANIGLIVKNGAVSGSVLVEAINGTSNAYIDADNIIFGKGVGTNSGDNFYMKLSNNEATIRNGSFNITKGNYAIIMNPTDGFYLKNGTSDIFYFKTDGSAKIGSWSVTADRLHSGSDANYMALSASDSENYVWAGAEAAASAPFRLTKAGKLYATGAVISGDITMTGGSISWGSIDESGSAAYVLANSASSTASSASTAANRANSDLANLVDGTYTGGTFIDRRRIISGEFYATDGDLNTYATMQSDGFKIFKSSTVTSIPKIQLISEGDGAINYLHLGAGSGATGEWINDKKFIIEQTASYAKLYYKHEETEYGFLFNSTGVTMLGDGAFEVGTQSYAVFG